MIKWHLYCIRLLLLLSVFWKLAGGLTNWKGKIWVFLYSLEIMSSNVFITHCYFQQYYISWYYLANVSDCYLDLHLCIVPQASLEVGCLKSKASSYILCSFCSALTSLVHSKYSCWSVHPWVFGLYESIAYVWGRII